ncbi:MAG: TadE/TadG family type IV pilus assembly protein [Candidatus Nanopelagicales bacterium]
MTRRAQRLRSNERGSAVIEFIIIGVLILVPLVYISICVMRVQAATVASSLAVREAGRAFVSADTVADAQSRAMAAARLALGDQGFELLPRSLRIRCSTAGCLQPESSVQVELDWSVDLPWLPEFLGEERTEIPIIARRTMPVDTYRGDQ